MELKHPFRNMCDIHALLDDCYKINTFCDRLEKQAEDKFAETFPVDDVENKTKAINKFKGDGLECLVEFLLKNMGTHTAINIQDYHLVSLTDDVGVDGKGINTMNKRSMTVQVKYRQANYVLTANEDHLCNFLSASQNRYGVSANDTQNMLIITTGDSVHYFTLQNMLHNKVRVINRNGLRELIDNKNAFWDAFKESMIESRTQQEVQIKVALRTHQQEAVDKILATIDHNQSGRITLPTGTGKTLVQAAAIVERIKKGDRIFTVFSPRILLSFQLLKEISKYLQSEGINAEYLNVNSGNFPADEINEAQLRAGLDDLQVESTTSPEKIASEVKRAREKNLSLIISSTYHSAEQIRTAKAIGEFEIDLQLNDEAHHLVSEEFNKFVNVGKRSFSFTATPKITDSDDGHGMQNAKFGEEIYKKTPKEMIEAGEMLPPALHIVTTDGGKHSNNYGEIFSCIVAAFETHVLEINRKSRSPEKIGAKLLVTLNGQKTLEGILECPEFLMFQKSNQNINIIAMSTDVGIYINGTKHENCNNTGKREVFDKLRTMGDTEQAIILYVDMLGEGIDVPGITAFMPIRGMCDSKFTQGVGRACRLSAIDRKKLYDGTMKPDERDCFVKPFAYVIIPDLTIGCEDYKEQYKNLLYELCDEFDIKPEHIKIEDKAGINKDSALDLVDCSGKGKKKITRAEIEQFYHEVKEDLDRPLEIHDLALIELYNMELCLVEE